MKNYISSGNGSSREIIENSEGEQDTNWYINNIKDSSAMFEYHEIESEINKITDKIATNDISALNTSNNSLDQSVDSFINTDSFIWKNEEKPEQTPQDFTDEYLHLIIKKRATSKAFNSKFLFPGEKADSAELTEKPHNIFRLNINSKAFSPFVLNINSHTTSLYANKYSSSSEDNKTSTPKRKEKKNITSNLSKQSFKDKMKLFRQAKRPPIEDHSKLVHVENIIKGKDKRTTLMIRHIPNKYTIVQILEDINIEFKDKYDLFYLPLDFVNNCNLGYAFINFVDSLHIIQFYEMFRGKKWRRFKSEKICELAYGKFQGKKELIVHFEKGSVMNFDSEDKKPLILPTPNPLPNVEIPLKYYQDFTEAYPWAKYEIFRDRILVHSLYGC